MQIMNHDHPRWREFLERLEGPEGCNFRKRDKDTWNCNEGEYVWNCNGQTDRPLAAVILEDMGDIDIPASMTFFDGEGGYCDCEILLNVA